MTPSMLKAAEKRAADDMTLEQIRAVRARVEGQILNLIEGFTKETGLIVESVEIEKMQTTSFGIGYAVLTAGVRLKLEEL